MRRAAAVVASLLLAGCARDWSRPPGASAKAVGDSVASFDPKQIGKSDVDRVADLHRREIFASVRVLAEKLYRRNPREWKKGGHASIEAALDRLLDPRLGWRLPESAGRRDTDAMLLALREDFAGDRVAVFIAGMGAMLNAAFDGKTEFFMLDELDPQKLYNSARNLEIAAWKLANARDAAGQPLLLSNETGQAAQPANLSFEREFGKMIGNLDLLSALIADKGHRTIARVAQSLATAVFLPVATLR
ncbi:MAG: hypothetical protein FD157_1241 [Rhodocyclaceae bacterium]|nr:MAG: hypothetical protein FD157_1241 [Rhodocyclaceae bacterium]TND02766.1 MAG: hypothetical protein FD118_1792 [Rhodocyclaceae bacterium]